MKVCDCCKEKRQYSDRFDAYYCNSCDIWLEKKCSDKTCGFCAERPEHPSEANNLWIDLYKDAIEIYVE